MQGQGKLNAAVWLEDHRAVSRLQFSLLLLRVASPVALFFQLLTFVSGVAMAQDRFEQVH
jgi:hypothetical protein